MFTPSYRTTYHEVLVMVCSGKQFGFEPTGKHSDAVKPCTITGRVFHVARPETAKLRGS